MHMAPFLVVSYTWLNMVSAWLEWQRSRRATIMDKPGTKNDSMWFFPIVSMI